MRKSSINKKKIAKECWDMNLEFIKWVNQHCRVYLKDADKIVDLEYYKFEYKGKEYTQKELIKMLINLTDQALGCDLWEIKELFDEICDIWKLIGPAMWW